MPDTQHSLKCRFCAWQTRRWRRTKAGHNRHGYQRLLDHVAHAHKAEVEVIDALAEADDLSAPDTLDDERSRGS